jgi:hypothetical protein
MIAKPIEIRAVRPYTLWLRFSDGVSGEVDLSYLATGEPFSAWSRDVSFLTAHLDAETDAVAWTNELELCPNSLYLKLIGKSFEQWKQTQMAHAPN